MVQVLHSLMVSTRIVGHYLQLPHYTAELYAIWQAVRYTEMNNSNITLICSDSLGALQSLADIFIVDPLLKSILAHIHRLDTQGKKVCFVWIPSHVGIRGNELADGAGINAQGDIPIRNADVKVHLKQNILNLWQKEWNGVDIKLEEIKPEVCK
ncbi:hypothetical protein NQ314_009365 [Rhamnusium bicolor]|uniref:RNase H type-1 domain-containing protein n=1 Tax=Rhamnusium bicolor TaxID=1586634 RepID=A0AAV8Y0J7_9CUCU|nr:hypothetical protein NQ314_009365 [Rhamnusium bicolor]